MKVAMIGCGYFAQFHRDAWARLPVEVVALCDAERAKVEAAGQDFPGARGFTDAAAMLEEARPELVDIVRRPPRMPTSSRSTPRAASRPMAPADMATAGSSPLANVSSLAFAGPGRREAWLGCLLADRIMRIPMPVAGHPPAH
ncbi:MAG TPA: Gfo/Idh/MocA family oxidoreductase [Falsiroseomonas sp.]|jgi:hypothetical protein|nr:Gfo/Idh/MocA family oxidoreductase [Falsiroseomonas sp.]